MYLYLYQLFHHFKNKHYVIQVNIIVGTGHGVRLFPNRLYEVTVFENRLAPLVILDLNATDEIAHKPVLYSIVGHDYNGKLSEKI